MRIVLFANNRLGASVADYLRARGEEIVGLVLPAGAAQVRDRDPRGERRAVRRRARRVGAGERGSGPPSRARAASQGLGDVRLHAARAHPEAVPPRMHQPPSGVPALEPGRLPERVEHRRTHSRGSHAALRRRRRRHGRHHRAAPRRGGASRHGRDALWETRGGEPRALPRHLAALRRGPRRTHRAVRGGKLSPGARRRGDRRHRSRARLRGGRAGRHPEGADLPAARGRTHGREPAHPRPRRARGAEAP